MIGCAPSSIANQKDEAPPEQLFNTYGIKRQSAAEQLSVKVDLGEWSTDGSDCSSLESPSFQLPAYLASPSSTPNQRMTGTSTTKKLSSTKRSRLEPNRASDPSTRNRLQEDQEEDDTVRRLVLLAKHPNADEARVQQVIEKQRKQQALAKEVAMKKGQKFRNQQALQEQKHLVSQRQKLQQKSSLRPLRLVSETPFLDEPCGNGDDDEEEEIDEEYNVIYRAPSHREKLVQERSGFTVDLIDDEDQDSFVVWQVAGQGTSESYNNTTIGEEPHGHRQAQQRRTEGGIRGLAKAVFGKIFPDKSSPPSPVSSGTSIASDNMDERSAISALDNKSHASKLSLPSLSSEMTRKVSNLSPKFIDNDNNMASIEEGDDDSSNEDDSVGRARWLTSTRNGFIILLLSLIIVVAIITTIVAAVGFDDDQRQPIDSSEGNNESFPGNSPSYAPSDNAVQPSFGIPTMPPVDMTPTVPTTKSPSVELTSPPDQGGVSSPPPLSSPTEYPSSAPTVAPTIPSTIEPTTSDFLEWEWTRKGLSFQGFGVDDRFGQSVALSEDGNTVAIGSPYASANGLARAGNVQIFKWDDTNRRGWVPHGFLQGRNAGDQFGQLVSLSSDGAVLAVSEPKFNGRAGDRSGNVRVFVGGQSGYSPLGQELEGEGATDHFGVGLAVSGDGRRLAIGSPYHDNSNGIGSGNNRVVSGQAKVFEWSSEDSRWVQVGSSSMVGASHLDWFGWSLDLNEDGSIVCVGAPRNLEYGGYVQCFEEIQKGNGNDWNLLGDTIQNSHYPIRYDDNFGTVVRVSQNPSSNIIRIAIGCPGKNRGELDSGLVVVYEFNPQDPEAGWTQVGEAVTSAEPSESNEMGSSLDLKGDILAVGIPGAGNSGQVNLFQFQRESKQWERHPRVLQGLNGANYGMAVSITAQAELAVGSPSIGAVVVYEAEK